jgi:hypothetical protein
VSYVTSSRSYEMKTVEYFAPGYSSIEDVREKHEIFDASTLQKVADCPRYYQIRGEEGWRREDGLGPRGLAGTAIHNALDFYYSHAVRDEAVKQLAEAHLISTWEAGGVDRATMEPGEQHLTAPHLTSVLSNYFHTWENDRIEIFQPATYMLDDLVIDDVIAAKWRINDRGFVVIGESNLIMKFDVDGEELVYAGKPDLPVVRQDGSIWIMDHKTTSSYLSDYLARNYETSNQLRGYAAMIRSLTGITPMGGIINGIYVGKHATNPNSKATRFARYAFDYASGHVDEALRNQLAWTHTIHSYRERGYWPQGCGYGGCSMPQICKADPDDRELIISEVYTQEPFDFWSL